MGKWRYKKKSNINTYRQRKEVYISTKSVAGKEKEVQIVKDVSKENTPSIIVPNYSSNKEDHKYKIRQTANNRTTIEKSLLYPAMHKFYSALNSLDQFEKGNNLFDNISHLDNFFSEYRNITFVLQKSLAHTEFIEIYKQNRDKYLLNETGKWFSYKRNEIIKEHPFDLEKRIIITIYSPETFSALPEQVFSIENDVEYSSLIESLQYLFLKISLVEVFFSVEFSFYEKGTNKELYEDLITGINNMSIFLQAMKDEIKEECEVCNQLQEKISKMIFPIVPKNMLFIDDYVYYCEINEFEKASRMEPLMKFSKKSKDKEIITSYEPLRIPLSSLYDTYKGFTSERRNAYDIFIIMHLGIFRMRKDLMPTFMIIYEDETFELVTCVSSIKTTVYRKINEIVNRMEKDKIKSIFYVTQIIHYSTEITDYKSILMTNSKERIKYKTSESLCFIMANNNLQFYSCYFDSNKIEDMKYISTAKKNNKDTLPIFFSPIRREFERIKEKGRS
jgi:hypothetical protein